MLQGGKLEFRMLRLHQHQKLQLVYVESPLIGEMKLFQEQYLVHRKEPTVNRVQLIIHRVVVLKAFWLFLMFVKAQDYR